MSLVITCTPGQDTALTVRNTLAGGRRAGCWTAAGVATGQGAWAIAAATGVAGLLRASAPAFLALKIIGCGYLLYLALQAFRSALSGTGHAPPEPHVDHRRAFRQGLISNLVNVKRAAFFISLLPQFGSGIATMLPLGLTFCALTVCWLATQPRAKPRAPPRIPAPAGRRAGSPPAPGCC